MIYSMLVLFTYWGSNLSIQAEVGKLNRDLLQPSRIRYEVWSFSVRHSISMGLNVKFEGQVCEDRNEHSDVFPYQMNDDDHLSSIECNEQSKEEQPHDDDIL